MDGEREGHTLLATALVHEVYLRLIDIKRVSWQDRSHFFVMAARLMRRVLVDHARGKRSQKRGAGAPGLHSTICRSSRTKTWISWLDAALDALGQQDPRKSQVVEMRYFAGLTIEETAAALDVSLDTVMRDWRLARAWLHRARRGVQVVLAPERWRAVETCHAALARGEQQRAEFLAEACGSDDALRREVEALLAHDSVGDSSPHR